MRPTTDHPSFDPGDGRPQCPTCGKWVWLVTHSCKGVRVNPKAVEAGGGEVRVSGQEALETCDHDWYYCGGVGAVGFEDGYECGKCGEVDQ